MTVSKEGAIKARRLQSLTFRALRRDEMHGGEGENARYARTELNAEFNGIRILE